jgi:hypothetical protein
LCCQRQKDDPQINLVCERQKDDPQINLGAKQEWKRGVGGCRGWNIEFNHPQTKFEAATQRK